MQFWNASDPQPLLISCLEQRYPIAGGREKDECWGVVANLKHLTEEWRDLANWRSNKTNHSIILIKKFKEVVTGKNKGDSSLSLTELENIIRGFELSARGILQ